MAIAADAVGTTELADNSVTSDKIVNATIVSGDIANNTILPANINPGGTNGQSLTMRAGTVVWDNPDITLNNLPDATTLGQVMYWNNSTWAFSSAAVVPSDDEQILRWDAVNNMPIWGWDGLRIPFTYNDDPGIGTTMFSLTSTNNQSNGINVVIPTNDAAGATSQYALRAAGGNAGYPTAVVERTTATNLSAGALAVNTTLNILNADAAAIKVSQTATGIDPYSTTGILVENTVTGSDAGHIQSAGTFNVNSDGASAVIGSISNADGGSTAQVFGALGVANTTSATAIAATAADQTAGVFGYNDEVGANDAAVLGISTTGTAIKGISAATAGTADNNYVAVVRNTAGDGRGMYIESNTADAVGLDPTDAQEAPLVVRNVNGASPKMAIKTYGDIWANSNIGATDLIGIVSVWLGNSISGPAYAHFDAPASAGGAVNLYGTAGDNAALKINGTAGTGATELEVVGDFTVAGSITQTGAYPTVLGTQSTTIAGLPNATGTVITLTGVGGNINNGGMPAGVEGRIVYLVNSTSANVILNLAGTSYTIPTGNMAACVYAAGLWRVKP